MPDHLHGSTVYRNLYSRKQYFYSMMLFCHRASPYSFNLISTLNYSLARTACSLQKLCIHLLEAGQASLALPRQSLPVLCPLRMKRAGTGSSQRQSATCGHSTRLRSRAEQKTHAQAQSPSWHREYLSKKLLSLRSGDKRI